MQLQSLLLSFVESQDDKKNRYENKKIEKKGFKASISLDAGIDEMLEIFKLRDTKIINNY